MASWNALRLACAFVAATIVGLSVVNLAVAFVTRDSKRSASTVARMATPIEDATWRFVLNNEEARPESGREMLEKVAA